MLTIRKANERGRADFGWLDSRHTFSFGDYYDPKHMGFGVLRVINDDTVSGGGGFSSHPHKDMEIISYVLEGELAHKDSMGNGSTIKPGDVQRMSAGTGVVHSEFNVSKTSSVHFLQIWILPRRPGLPSGYEQKFFSADEKRGKLRLVVSPDGTGGSLKIQQEANVYASLLEKDEKITHVFEPGRKGWLQIARGSAVANGVQLGTGDGLAIENERELSISTGDQAELLLFDMRP
jgi:quercetin 2,3-dioxygenase